MGKINNPGIIEAEISWAKLFEFNKDTKYKPEGEYCVATFSEEQKQKLLDTKVPPSGLKTWAMGLMRLSSNAHTLRLTGRAGFLQPLYLTTRLLRSE